MRIVTCEKRTSKDGNNPIEAGMMGTICTIFYNKFDFQFKKGVDREPPTEVRHRDGEIVRDNSGQAKTIAYRAR